VETVVELGFRHNMLSFEDQLEKTAD